MDRVTRNPFARANLAAGDRLQVGDLVEWPPAGDKPPKDGDVLRYGRIVELDRVMARATILPHGFVDGRLALVSRRKETVPLAKLRRTRLASVGLDDAALTAMSDDEFIRVMRSRHGVSPEPAPVADLAGGEPTDDDFVNALRVVRGESVEDAPAASDFSQDADDALSGVSDDEMVSRYRRALGRA